MQVYYFTRSGNSEKIANEIAQSHGITAHKISDGMDWSGKKSFIKAGAMSAKKEVLKVEHHEIEQSGDVILVFPVWAGTLPPAVRGFLQGVDAKRITAVSVSAMSFLKEKDTEMFKKTYGVKGKVISAPSEVLGTAAQ